MYETPIIIELIIANTGENLKKNESAIQKAKIEIKQMQILNKESDSRIKELEFSIIENKKENEKIKNDLLY